MIELFLNQSLSTKWKILKEKERWKVWFSEKKDRQNHQRQNFWKWKHTPSVNLAWIINKSNHSVGRHHHYTSDWCETEKRRDGSRHPKCVCTNINCIGQGQDYYGDKRRTGQYNSWLFLGLYNKYVRYEGGKKILYVQMLKALYGILVCSILYYKRSRKDI